MRFLRLIMVVLFVAILPREAGAQSIVYSENYFVVEGRKVVVKGCDEKTRVEISEKILATDGIAMEGFFAKSFLPSIKFHPTASVEGKATAYQIVVKKSRVEVRYTSAEMLSLAVEQLFGLFTVQNGRWVIRGATVSLYRDSSTISLRSNREGIYDGITTELSEKQLKRAIDSKRTDKFILAMGNSSLYRVNFKVFEAVNPNCKNISKEIYYTTEEILSLVQYAKSKGTEFIPALDLLSENSAFEEVTGHSIHSVEGMRFVRAMIEECAESWGVKTLCIGTKRSDTAPKYYTEFLYDIASRNSLTLIIL